MTYNNSNKGATKMNAAVERDILKEVVKVVQTTLKLPSDDLDVDAGLETFGVDSINAMELMENLSKTFAMSVTPTEFVEVDTIREIATLVEDSLVSEEAEVEVTAAAPAPGVADNVLKPAVSYLNQRYGIALDVNKYKGVEDAVSDMVGNHAPQLLRHFGLDGSTTGAGVQNRDIAIVGISCRLPDADNAQAFWQNLMNGHNSFKEIPAERWQVEDFYDAERQPGKTQSKWAALIDDVDCFDPDFFEIPANEAITMDPQERLLLQEAYRAFEDGGINLGKLSGSNTGVFVGYEYAEYEHFLRNNSHLLEEQLPQTSSSPTYYLANRISFALDLCGPSESINVNCAGSAVAINRACQSLIAKESSLAIAGAASINLFADDYVAASQFGLLSPTGTSAVFNDAADGYTRGEGVAMIVMKPLLDAERDNNKIYAVIKTAHQNNRGKGRFIAEVQHESITDVLAQTYDKAGLNPVDVDYIEVDGYATKWADSFEFEGIKNLYANTEFDGKSVALGSLKANIGNTESVSGVANVIKLAMSMYNKAFPATINTGTINSFIDIDSAEHPLYIADAAINFDDIRRDDKTPIRAGVNSFADSGVNVHILLEEYQPKTEKQPANVSGQQLFVLSARTESALAEYVDGYVNFLQERVEQVNFADLIYTAQMGRVAMNNRLAVLASNAQELLDKLLAAQKAELKAAKNLEKKGIYLGKVDEANPLVGLVTPEMVNTQLQLSLQSRKFAAVAPLWANGVDVDWSLIWQGVSVSRTSLPSYPFERKRVWPGKAGEVVNQAIATAQVAARKVEAVKESKIDSAEPQYLFFVSDEAVEGALSLEPNEKIELFMQHEMVPFLGRAIEDIATDVNFLELGMDSVGITEVIIKVDKLFGINLSPSTLFKYPEIGTLADYLAENYEDTASKLVVANIDNAAAQKASQSAQTVVQQVEKREISPKDIVILMQPKGDKAAVFALPGADGSILSLQQLSGALGESQPFYGLEAVGIDGSCEPLESLEAVAAFNIAAMKTVQAEGPYQVVGYSNGGIVGFEMARQLLAGGDKVSLGLIDSVSPAIDGPDMVSETVDVFKQLIETLGGELKLTADELREVPEQERSEYLYSLVAEHGLDFPKTQFMATFAVSTASEQQCRSYEPQQLDIPLTLYRATEGYQGLPDDYGWQAAIKGDLRVVEVKAGHFDIIHDEAIKTVATDLVDALAAAQPQIRAKAPAKGKAKTTTRGSKARTNSRKRATT